MQQILKLCFLMFSLVSGLAVQSFADHSLREYMVFAKSGDVVGEEHTLFGVAEHISQMDVVGNRLQLISDSGRRITVTYLTSDRANSARLQIRSGGSIDVSACTVSDEAIRTERDERCQATTYVLQSRDCEIHESTPVWFTLDSRLFNLTAEIPGQLLVERQICRQHLNASEWIGGVY